MGYHVKARNIDETYLEYDSFLEQQDSSLLGALQELSEAVRALSVMRSFSGEAATSIKSYFSEYHGMIIQAIQELAVHLRYAYAMRYMSWYWEAPISENDEAVLPEDEMVRKADLVRSLRDERISSIQSELAAAAACVPSGFGFAFPRVDATLGPINAALDEVVRIREDVLEHETIVARMYNAPGNLYALAAKSASNLFADGGVAFEMGAYQPGDVDRHSSVRELHGDLQVLASVRQEGAEEYVSIRNQCIDRQIIREEGAFRILEEGRSQWEMVGVGFGAVGVVAGAAATVVSGGAVPALFAGASLLKGMVDTAGRIQDLRMGVNATTAPGKGGVTVESAAASASMTLLSKAASKFAGGKGQSWKTGVSREVKGTVSVVGNASKAGQLVADFNQDRMRKEAQGRLEKIEELKKQRSAPVTPSAFLGSHPSS